MHGSGHCKCLHRPHPQLLGAVSLQGVLGERVPAFLGQISLLLALGSCSPWLTDHSSLPPSALPRWQHRRCSEHPLSHPDLAAISSLTRKMTLLVVLPPTNPTCAGRELPDPWEALGTSCCDQLKRETLCRSSMWCWPHNDSSLCCTLLAMPCFISAFGKCFSCWNYLNIKEEP